MADVLRLGISEVELTPLDGSLIAKGKRLKFIVSFAALAAKMDVFAGHDQFPSSLKLITGHAALWGWYLAAVEAVDDGNAELGAILWEAALPVTVQAHLSMDFLRLALESMKSNSDLCINAKTMMDTFPGFAH